MPSSKDEGIVRTRRKVQQAVEQAEAEHRRQLLRKRIQLANDGIRAVAAKKPIEAVRAFQTYIRILEDWKGVSEGGLTPSHFDAKKEAAELLLISGVYWDLVKLFDRTSSAGKQKEFLHYMEKYILFSRGMPFQALCSETLRKHISLGNPKHKDEFKHAYKLIAVTRCFVATALCDVTHVDTAPALREFRDEVLSRSALGRVFIQLYYRVGPALADFSEAWPRPLRVSAGRLLDLSARRFRCGRDGRRTGRR